MKKNLLLASLLAFAGTGAMAQSAFQGFYGQLGVGYQSVDAGFPSGTITSGTGQGQGYSMSSSNGNSVFGNVGIGAYFPVTQSFLLGLGADYSPIESSSTNYTFSAGGYSSNGSWKYKDSYTIFISPAYAIDKDKLAYAKVGYAATTTTLTYSDGTNDSTNFSGYALGLGYKQVITGGIYAFGEVNYASYNSKNLASDVSGSVKPTSMNALVGVGYKF